MNESHKITVLVYQLSHNVFKLDSYDTRMISKVETQINKNYLYQRTTLSLSKISSNK